MRHPRNNRRKLILPQQQHKNHFNFGGTDLADYKVDLQTRNVRSVGSLVKVHIPHHLPLVVLSEQLIVCPLYRGWRDNKALRAMPRSLK